MTENTLWRRRHSGGIELNHTGSASLTDGVSARTRLRKNLQGYSDEYRTRQGLFLGQVKQEAVTEPSAPQGTIKVWIPWFTSHYADEQMFEAQEDKEKEQYWITCYPLMPLAGESVDRDGKGNSYGFSFAPPLNSWVGVMFARADPNAAYWFGGAPQLNSGVSSPDGPANQVEDVDHDHVPGGVSPEDVKPQTVGGNNLVDSGLASDPIRGAAKYTGPSKVVAVRSYGSKERPGVPKINGHSIVMNDHPEHRFVKMESSHHGMIMINDTGKLIYFKTQTGRTWMEMRDDGDIYVHAERDIAMNAGRDITIGAGRDIIVHAKRDFYIDVDQDLLMTIGKSFEVTADDSIYMSGVKMNVLMDEKYVVSAAGIDTIASGKQRHYSGGDFNIGSGAIIKIDAVTAVKTQGESAAAPAAKPTRPEKE